MSFKSKVIITTNENGLEKVLEVSKDFKPTKILALSKYSIYILTWDWVAWNNWDNLPCKKIEDTVKSLDYFDLLILNEDYTVEEFHSKEAPRIVGIEVGYWDNGNLIFI